MTLADKVYQVTSQIPKGKVTTYGAILHVNPNAPTVPCHRVVNAAGQLAKNFGSKGKILTHAARLRAEGVVVTNNKVDLQKYLWTP